MSCLYQPNYPPSWTEDSGGLLITRMSRNTSVCARERPNLTTCQKTPTTVHHQTPITILTIISHLLKQVLDNCLFSFAPKDNMYFVRSWWHYIWGVWTVGIFSKKHCFSGGFSLPFFCISWTNYRASIFYPDSVAFPPLWHHGEGSFSLKQ